MRQQDHLKTISKCSLALPEVEEGTAYGTPAFRVRGKLFARLHEDGESLVLKMDFESRDIHIQVNPAVFSITDHYRNYPYVLVNLTVIQQGELQELLEQAWRSCAPKRLLSDYLSKRIEHK
ncbi:MmcQ/YjbR family DNA-binding protein [Paenibacillus mendelii]|uniref:MmcQ/YjbR family DNA-binding protein n=1 Tax=Paenibacillus mendelii TaxID=206163 RepID=A0ABV6J660_9BACL|nr:MmcQ/YjbR family DNA-binding protein [Paenibacillus mendelii]MCQ6560304.1 MmcQ/YjbR family DNA-binding protein [Paenibacillus mendelii]